VGDTACMTPWEQAERSAREKAYRTLDNDPRILLEGDGGPGSIRAEVYMARMLGYDDEVVADGLRLPRPEPVYRMPIVPRGPLFAADDDPLVPTIRAATYVLQSGFALVTLAAEYAPPGVTLRDDFTFRVLYLRYRRRDR
jgi:hypothetical protein